MTRGQAQVHVEADDDGEATEGKVTEDEVMEGTEDT